LKDNRSYIEHILQAIDRIYKYTQGISRDDFDRNEMLQDAVIRNIEIIGEAAKNISNSFKKTYPEIPWREMSGMRDKLIHDYIGTDLEVVWKTIEIDLPELKKLLRDTSL